MSFLFVCVVVANVITSFLVLLVVLAFVNLWKAHDVIFSRRGENSPKARGDGCGDGGVLAKGGGFLLR